MATLKISDLSVGDWVQDKNGIYAKVLGIENWSNGYFLNIKLHGVNVGVTPLASAHPIPITPEILEANGFVKYGGVYIWSNKKHRVFVCLKEFSRSIDIEEMDEQFVSPKSSRIEVSQLYAHQLQHALRLAGVDKEINL